jgi:glycosyltransferase involved in cell wall biosynthesis
MNTILPIKSELIRYYPVSIIHSIDVLEVVEEKKVEVRLPQILFVSSFPPRECGIATYTDDLIKALEQQFEGAFECTVCALETNTESFQYQKPPKYVLNTEREKDYLKTAFLINKDPDIDLVVVQHEFGFYHEHERDFYQWLEAMDKPIMIVLHTVLPHPTLSMRKKVNVISYLVTSIMVMTQSAADILVNDYGIRRDHIDIIPHGSHLVVPVDKTLLKKKYNLKNKKVLATFGLLSAGKGIETTLRALPEIVKSFPDVMFLVLGKTHPAIIKREGEIYRERLESLVRELNLQEHVVFVNEYLPLNELLEYLQICDVYLFTTVDPMQAVSGTFSYAVSAGCPIVSTRIPHAVEVLNDSNGVFIDFNSHEQLACAVNDLLGDTYRLEEMSAASLHRMASTSWQNTAIKHALVFQDIASASIRLNYKIPVLKLDHLERLTDDFGMFQFATIAKPDIDSGYTLDDNSRALIAACQHFSLQPNTKDLRLIEIYLQFIDHCLVADGVFLNYVSHHRKFSGQNYNENIEDSTGRAIWALGYVCSMKGELPQALVSLAEELLDEALAEGININSTRSMAFMLKGLYYENNSSHQHFILLFANRLLKMYQHEKESSWNWYEGYLTYGNAVLPEAMLCAYIRTGVTGYLQAALESFDFLISKIFVNGRLKIISNNGWHQRGEMTSIFVGGEQPIDVAYTILALETFYMSSNLPVYKELSMIAFEWFLGNNDLNQMVYNPATGGCQDGVEQYNVNLNQGAESTVSYLLARLSLQRIMNHTI